LNDHTNKSADVGKLGAPPDTFHIITSGVVTAIDQTIYLETVHISVSSAGNNSKIGIRNKETPPKFVIPMTTMIDPGADVSGQFFNPNPQHLFWMEGGADIVTAGNTPGIVDVWITYYKPKLQT
jgi:hypothetical protein